MVNVIYVCQFQLLIRIFLILVTSCILERRNATKKKNVRKFDVNSTSSLMPFFFEQPAIQSIEQHIITKNNKESIQNDSICIQGKRRK